MENASKALLMAGGILIALLVIGALLLMFNQISTYQQSETSNEKNIQLAQFNMDFEKYLDDKGISGSDIVTLSNKIIDYNSKLGSTHDVTNSVDYSIKISLEVNMQGFQSKYGYSSGGIFSDKTYTVTKNGGTLKQIIDKYNPIFSGNNKKLITQLTDVYIRNRNRNTNLENIRKTLGDDTWTGNGTGTGKNEWLTLDNIKNYKEYTEFRTSTFKISQDPVYKNGQIQNLYFKWEK